MLALPVVATTFVVVAALAAAELVPIHASRVFAEESFAVAWVAMYLVRTFPTTLSPTLLTMVLVLRLVFGLGSLLGLLRQGRTNTYRRKS